MTDLTRRDWRTCSRQDRARQGLDHSVVIGNAGRNARGCDQARAGAATALRSCRRSSQLPTRRRSPRVLLWMPGQQSFGAIGALRGGDCYSRRGAARQSAIGSDVRDDSMLLRAVEEFHSPDPDSTFGMLLLPGSESPSGSPVSGGIAERGSSGSPARSQPGRLGRFPSKPFRPDSRPSGWIRPSNREGGP